jgi:hypothetical protein
MSHLVRIEQARTCGAATLSGIHRSRVFEAHALNPYAFRRLALRACDKREGFSETMMWLPALLFIAVCMVLLGVVIAIAMANDQLSTLEERAAWDRQHRDQRRPQP